MVEWQSVQPRETELFGCNCVSLRLELDCFKSKDIKFCTLPLGNNNLRAHCTVSATGDSYPVFKDSAEYY
jgi:hypothetical protein